MAKAQMTKTGVSHFDAVRFGFVLLLGFGVLRNTRSDKQKTGASCPAPVLTHPSDEICVQKFSPVIGPPSAPRSTFIWFSRTKLFV